MMIIFKNRPFAISTYALNRLSTRSALFVTTKDTRYSSSSSDKHSRDVCRKIRLNRLGLFLPLSAEPSFHNMWSLPTLSSDQQRTVNRK